MPEFEELPIPDAVIAARKKAEMARIWIADGDQVVALSAHLWDDPGAWGLMLVDLTRHLSKAYAARGLHEADVVSRIRSAMEAEWSNPTE
jgi:hypothetical protein